MDYEKILFEQSVAKQSKKQMRQHVYENSLEIAEWSGKGICKQFQHVLLQLWANSSINELWICLNS